MIITYCSVVAIYHYNGNQITQYITCPINMFYTLNYTMLYVKYIPMKKENNKKN